MNWYHQEPIVEYCDDAGREIGTVRHRQERLSCRHRQPFRQLDQLIDRHTYNRATFNSWASARQLKIVEVEFCDRAVAEIAAAVGDSANVARLQAFLAAQAKVRAGLQSKGYSTGDVIAADHSGSVLIVYVI